MFQIPPVSYHSPISNPSCFKTFLCFKSFHSCKLFFYQILQLFHILPLFEILAPFRILLLLPFLVLFQILLPPFRRNFHVNSSSEIGAGSPPPSRPAPKLNTFLGQISALDNSPLQEFSRFFTLSSLHDYIASQCLEFFFPHDVASNIVKKIYMSLVYL